MSSTQELEQLITNGAIQELHATGRASIPVTAWRRSPAAVRLMRAALKQTVPEGKEPFLQITDKKVTGGWT